MDAANTPRTTRDALTIDLLGDVGRLHDEIKTLPANFEKEEMCIRDMHCPGG